MQIIQCPSCGGSNEIKNPGITMTTCQYCQSTLYWDARAIVQTGAKAILPENDTRLWLGATGKIKETPFEVLGRIRFAAGQTHWDDWFITYGSDFAWLGENGRELSIRSIISNPEQTLGRQRPLLGGSLFLKGENFSIREADRAQCEGIQGELPFAVPPTETINYYNAASNDGARFAQLSFNQRNQARLTIGSVLAHSDLHLNGQESLMSQYDNMKDGQALSCASCGSALAINSVNGAKSVTCEACGAINDISGQESKLIQKIENRAQLAQKLSYPIGKELTIDGAKFQICGRQILSKDFGYEEHLYLLYNNEQSYRYLYQNRGENLLLQKTNQAPAGNAQTWLQLKPGASCLVGNTNYRIQSVGNSQIIFVDGAFPWIAKIGEETKYIRGDNSSDFYMLKKSGTDLDFYCGKKFSDSELEEAFSGKSLVLKNISPNNSDSDSPAQSSKIGAIIAIVVILIIIVLVIL